MSCVKDEVNCVKVICDDIDQGRIEGIFEAGIPVWAPKFGGQTIFSGHFIFNGVLWVNLLFNQIRSKGLKKACDCTLKLRLVYINFKKGQLLFIFQH